jgi:hypothetical protein
MALCCCRKRLRRVIVLLSNIFLVFHLCNTLQSCVKHVEQKCESRTGNQISFLTNLHTPQLLLIFPFSILKTNIQLIILPQTMGIFTVHFMPPLINIGPPPIDYMTLIIELSLFTEHLRLPPIALSLFTEHLRLPPIALSLFTEHLRLPPIALSLFTEHLRLPPIALSLFTEHLRLPLTDLSLFTEHLRLPLTDLRLFTEGFGLTSRGFVPPTKG